MIIKKKSHREAWTGEEGMWGALKSNTGRLFRKSLKNNPYLFSVIHY